MNLHVHISKIVLAMNLLTHRTAFVPQMMGSFVELSHHALVLHLVLPSMNIVERKSRPDIQIFV